MTRGGEYIVLQPSDIHFEWHTELPPLPPDVVCACSYSPGVCSLPVCSAARAKRRQRVADDGWNA